MLPGHSSSESDKLIIERRGPGSDLRFFTGLSLLLDLARRPPPVFEGPNDENWDDMLLRPEPEAILSKGLMAGCSPAENPEGSAVRPLAFLESASRKISATCLLNSIALRCATADERILKTFLSRSAPKKGYAFLFARHYRKQVSLVKVKCSMERNYWNIPEISLSHLCIRVARLLDGIPHW